MVHESDELRKARLRYEEHWKPKIAELNDDLSRVVGLDNLKIEFLGWIKGMILEERLKAHGIPLSKNPPLPLPPRSMLFNGNSGSGRSLVSQIFGRLFHNMGILPTCRVTEVAYTHLLGSNIKEKVKEAAGGILFVRAAHKLKDVQVVEEIASAVHSREIVVIFSVCSGWENDHFITLYRSCFKGSSLGRQFNFGDLSVGQLAKIVCVKMKNQLDESPFYGFKLHPSCTEEAIENLLKKSKANNHKILGNGHFVNRLLAGAQITLSARLDFNCYNLDDLVTLTLEDLQGGLALLS